MIVEPQNTGFNTCFFSWFNFW